MTIAATVLVDTNVLVYRLDPRFPEKRERARTLLREAVANDAACIAHQTVIEFVSAVLRPQRDGSPLLPFPEAVAEAEQLFAQYEVLYPTEEVVRTALRGVGSYGLSWYDAHLWAYADAFGIEELWSEDFQHNRRYGRVRVVNPFL